MIRRNDGKGSLYLPGGGHQDNEQSVSEATTMWVNRQTSVQHIDVEGLAYWTMSNGTIVRLVRSVSDLPANIWLSTEYGDQYVKEIGWLTYPEIVGYHIIGYLPWAQFKLAMFTLSPGQYLQWNGRPNGADLKEEFQDFTGRVWPHPDFRTS